MGARYSVTRVVSDTLHCDEMSFRCLDSSGPDLSTASKRNQPNSFYAFVVNTRSSIGNDFLLFMVNRGKLRSQMKCQNDVCSVQGRTEGRRLRVAPGGTSIGGGICKGGGKN